MPNTDEHPAAAGAQGRTSREVGVLHIVVGGICDWRSHPREEDRCYVLYRTAVIAQPNQYNYYCILLLSLGSEEAGSTVRCC